MTKIGVFDSGIGGLSVARRLEQLFPGVEVIFVNDSKNVPYGSRPQEEIVRLTDAALQPLIQAACDAIVIACNTATTNAIGELRNRYPAIHFVGIEPMVKPAAQLTKTNVIAVLATPSTLASHRYQELKKQWTAQLTVVEPDCTSWAGLIEHDHADDIAIEPFVDTLKQQNVDVIVLGCTHYHWLKERVQQAAGPQITVLEPSDAIGARIDSLLFTNALLPE